MISQGKVVDLSPLLQPGYEKRRLAIRSFIYEPDKTIMHDIDTMSHIGSHVEAPSHFKSVWSDIASLEISKFYGAGTCIDLRYKASAEAITVGDLEGKVKNSDIVLLHAAGRREGDPPYISGDAARWFSEHIKMLGIDDTVSLEESFELMASHTLLLQRGIPIIEGLVNLDQVVGQRFTFIGLPLKIKGLDASPIRAIALL